MDKTPVYTNAAAYAREHDEMEQYRVSMNADKACKSAIESAIREKFDGMHLDHDTAKLVISDYGVDRVNHVLANTVQQKDWDGRFSYDNKQWAKTFVIPEDKDGFGSDRRSDCVVESHPAVLDGFINQARHEYLLTQPLTNMEIEKEANRLLTQLRSEREPNSPSGTHFMAQISDDFMFRASSKDTDKLSALLPFKGLSLSSLKDKRGVFAIINSDEPRDKPLRQPKSSVVSKLHDTVKSERMPKTHKPAQER